LDGAVGLGPIAAVPILAKSAITAEISSFGVIENKLTLISSRQDLDHEVFGRM
jgi:hypothetical protein